MKQQLNDAFKALRAEGFFARQNFMCCGGCGAAAVPAEKQDAYVFFHSQDNARFEKGDDFYLAWNGDGAKICQVLAKHGIATLWNGDENMRIRVINKEVRQ